MFWPSSIRAIVYTIRSQLHPQNEEFEFRKSNFQKMSTLQEIKEDKNKEKENEETKLVKLKISMPIIIIVGAS